MRTKAYNRGGFTWLELLLVLAFLALLFQVFPSLWQGLLWAVDVRNWSRGTWLGLNVAVLLVLFSIRFKRELTPLVLAILSPKRRVDSARGKLKEFTASDDYEARTRRDAEWRERAKNRLPFT